MTLSYEPLTQNNWTDFEELFGARGACAGCWCMVWRLPRSQFENQKYEGNRLTMKQLVDSGGIPGILGYVEEHNGAVAWISLGPREDFPALSRSRIMKPVDDQAVWSISCLFVAKLYRGAGISVKMIGHAVDFARKMGGLILEAYPVEPKSQKMPDAFAWTGLASAFRSAGFEEVARRSATRPIMRVSI